MNRLTACGTDCRTCDYQESQKCSGCFDCKGKVWWLKYINETVCPIYKCATIDKGFSHCGYCDELPCDFFWKLKDPDLSDEEHKISVLTRVGRLDSLML